MALANAKLSTFYSIIDQLNYLVRNYKNQIICLIADNIMSYL